MLILNMWKEIYENCYSIICCQFNNIDYYNLPSNIDYSNVKYSNLQQKDIFVCPGQFDISVLDNKPEINNLDLDLELYIDRTDDEYDIIDNDDINI